MTNDEMKPGRFLRWARARKKVAAIQAHLLAGGEVVIANYCHATCLTKAAHAEFVKADKTGSYIRSGKKWLCFDGNAVRFISYPRRRI